MPSILKNHLGADPRKAAEIIAHLSKPGNEGLSNKQAARDLGTNEAYVRRAKATFGWSETVPLDPKIIRRDGGTQPRDSIDQDVIVEYGQAMQGKAIFPPVVVFYDGTSYWLADGFHRVLAAIWAKRPRIACQVEMGEARDARLYSVGVNATHGLRRTNSDKRRAVMTLLMDEDWSRWSNRNIAERCKVSAGFVDSLRNELSTANGRQLEAERTYERNGKIQTMNVEKIGSSAASNDDLEDAKDDGIVPLHENAAGPAPGEGAVHESPQPATPDESRSCTQIDPPRAARSHALGAIESEWPELASLLRSEKGWHLSDGTLAAVAHELNGGD